MPGVVELGGKSMQIAYADPTIPADQLGPGWRGRAVCLFKYKYHVASYSWVLVAEESRFFAVERKLVTAAPHLDIEPFTKWFYAVSSFWYTYGFFSQVGLYDKHSPYDPELFRKAAEQYCNGSWLNPFPWHEDGRDNEHIHKH